MKTYLWPKAGGRFLLALTLGLVLSSRAQIIVSNPLLPVVTLQATDPLASWSGDTGTFTVFRAGPTNADLNIYYLIGGTASNGVDYATIGHWVSIPAGVRTNTITITPINNGQTNIETVVLKLAPSPLMIPINYVIGYPNVATVFITPAGVTNIPPLVTLTSPSDGSVFYTPVDIPLVAVTSDLDGFVTSVEFFAGTNSLGVVTNWVVLDPLPLGGLPLGGRGFFLTWSNVLTGSYTLTAKATDSGGATTVSDPVSIMVLQGPPPPPTNVPPLVRIISPPNNSTYYAPVDVPILAYAADPDGSVVNVEFFAGTNDLGSGRVVCPVPLPVATGGLPTIYCRSNWFSLVWSNAPLGSYGLTAVATDDGGASTVSPAVNITILPSPPPPTNRPPIVNIVATDPIAIEGTNCWPWWGLASGPITWSNWVAPTAVCRFFTNCGPKSATFTVRRFGATNDDLVVAYGIGGSATNGVDYSPLSGSVTIPAGLRRADITVMPLDDGPPDLNSTVVLRLQPGTNYVVGFPRAAAALIIDNGWPRPVPVVLPDHCFHLSAPGPDGAWFHIDFTTDLMNWTSLCTNQVVNGSIDFVDPDAATDQARFYRAVPEANPPAQ